MVSRVENERDSGETYKVDLEVEKREVVSTRDRRDAVRHTRVASGMSRRRRWPKIALLDVVVCRKDPASLKYMTLEISYTMSMKAR